MADDTVLVRLPGTPARSYRVIVGGGQLPRVGERMQARGWILIADRDVAALYGEMVATSLARDGARVVVASFAPGEASKTRATVASLQDVALEAGAGRDWAVAALGGGVAGDLGGFVAATLLRGLPVLQLPTSLMAMVDSSIGGKTGVDTAVGKNLVGAFHQPAEVVADTDTLATLPEAEMRSGLAEVIKYGVIADAELLTDLEDGLVTACLLRQQDALQSVILRSVRHKAAVVQADEHEQGLREVLNFGHTVGHALERCTGYTLRHGEAVAIGMVVEATVAARAHGGDTSLPARLAALCHRAGLPTTLPRGISAAAVLEAARRDKKVRAGALRCALPLSAGAMLGASASTVRDADLLAALEEAG